MASWNCAQFRPPAHAGDGRSVGRRRRARRRADARRAACGPAGPGLAAASDRRAPPALPRRADSGRSLRSAPTRRPRSSAAASSTPSGRVSLAPAAFSRSGSRLRPRPPRSRTPHLPDPRRRPHRRRQRVHGAMMTPELDRQLASLQDIDRRTRTARCGGPGSRCGDRRRTVATAPAPLAVARSGSCMGRVVGGACRRAGGRGGRGHRRRCQCRHSTPGRHRSPARADSAMFMPVVPMSEIALTGDALVVPARLSRMTLAQFGLPVDPRTRNRRRRHGVARPRRRRACWRSAFRIDHGSSRRIPVPTRPSSIRPVATQPDRARRCALRRRRRLRARDHRWRRRVRSQRSAGVAHRPPRDIEPRWSPKSGAPCAPRSRRPATSARPRRSRARRCWRSSTSKGSMGDASRASRSSANDLGGARDIVKNAPYRPRRSPNPSRSGRRQPDRQKIDDACSRAIAFGRTRQERSGERGSIGLHFDPIDGRSYALNVDTDVAGPRRLRAIPARFPRAAVPPLPPAPQAAGGGGAPTPAPTPPVTVSRRAQAGGRR